MWISARAPISLGFGINAIELLPIQEFPTVFSMGYNGTDLYSPENQYAETDEARLRRYFDLTNAVLRDAGEKGSAAPAPISCAAPTTSCAP